MLRPLGNNFTQTQGIKRISVDEWKKKAEGAGEVQGPNPNEEPKTIDPLTGKMITASESKAKYGDGSKLIYVKIDGEVTEGPNGPQKGMGKIEKITVAEYQRRYYDYTEPPKAAESLDELLGIDRSNMKQADNEARTIDPLTGKIITATEFKEKYGEGNQLLQVAIPRDNGMAMMETMTVKEYCHRYYNVVDPPKATLVDDDFNKTKAKAKFSQYLNIYDTPPKFKNIAE